MTDTPQFSESRFTSSAELGDLAAALSAAQEGFPTIPKNKTARMGQYNYSYADLSDILPVVQPILAANGLAVIQAPSSDSGKQTLVTMLLHSSGQWVRSEMDLFIGASTAQGQGSAITYARRYALGAVLQIVTDDDDDGDLATRVAPATSPSRTRATAAPPTGPPPTASNGDEERKITPAIRKALDSQIAKVEGWDTAPDEVLTFISTAVGAEIKNLDNLTYDQGKTATQAVTALNNGK